jgi:hypothetical protein
MRRREFVAGLGIAAARPRVAWAQQGERIRRIGMIMAIDNNDPARLDRSAVITVSRIWMEGKQAIGLCPPPTLVG